MLVKGATGKLSLSCVITRITSAPFQHKAVLRGMRISVIRIRRSRDHLVFIMGIPILARRYLYIENDHQGQSSIYKRGRSQPMRETVLMRRFLSLA